MFNIYARGGSNKYPQSMFWIKHKKNRYNPVKYSIMIYKGYKGLIKGFVDLTKAFDTVSRDGL